MYVRKKLKIELKSDLCIASGYSYAGLIDSDICYDDRGIPYIPGRRLKGCLRETAEKELYGIISENGLDGDEDPIEKQYNRIEEIFGRGRDDGTNGIIVENAYPIGYAETSDALSAIAESPESKLKEVFAPQNILNQFTTVKAQTKLDDSGVAENNTFRYIRTVNQFAPGGKRLVFESYITYKSTPIRDEFIPLIIRATKHIGLNRNRGLGNIRCTLCDDDEWSEVANDNTQYASERGTIHDGKRWKIVYSIRNDEPLMLSNMRDDTSETLIRGQSVLGLLAAEYLKDGRMQSNSKEFRDLFLNGKTRYSDLVICRDGEPYYPAPLFLRKLKKSDMLVNIEYAYDQGAFDEETAKNYTQEGGNQPKKINGQYVRFDQDYKIDVAEVEKRLVFHHSQRGSNRYDNEAILYTNEVLAENQVFMGTISVPEAYVKRMISLMTNADFRFGKSKTAQYGKCRLISLNATQIGGQESVPQHKPCGAKVLEKGDMIAVVFLSDTFLLYQSESEARLTVFRDEVMRIVADELSKKGIDCQPVSNDYAEKISNPRGITFIETTEVGGYNTKINMRKSVMPAIKAGSVICYQVMSSAVCIEDYLGEKTHEGFGHFKIFALNKMSYAVNIVAAKQNEKKLSSGVILAAGRMINDVIEDFLKEQIKSRAIDDVKDKPENLNGLSASIVGRVTLMLREALEENRDDKDAADKAFDSFYKRVESIKRDEEKNVIRHALLSRIAKSTLKKDRKMEWNLSAEKIGELFDNNHDIEFLEKLQITESDKRNLLRGLWSDYIMTVLVYWKYLKAER